MGSPFNGEAAMSPNQSLPQKTGGTILVRLAVQSVPDYMDLVIGLSTTARSAVVQPSVVSL